MNVVMMMMMMMMMMMIDISCIFSLGCIIRALKELKDLSLKPRSMIFLCRSKIPKVPSWWHEYSPRDDLTLGMKFATI